MGFFKKASKWVGKKYDQGSKMQAKMQEKKLMSLKRRAEMSRYESKIAVNKARIRKSKPTQSALRNGGMSNPMFDGGSMGKSNNFMIGSQPKKKAKTRRKSNKRKIVIYQ